MPFFLGQQFITWGIRADHGSCFVTTYMETKTTWGKEKEKDNNRGKEEKEKEEEEKEEKTTKLNRLYTVVFKE